MVAVPSKPWISPQQYLALEDHAEFRSEYWNGEIVAMAGGSPAHNRIVRNLARRLGNQLDGTACEPYLLETKVRVSDCNTYFYPDILIACGPIELEEGATEAVHNPIAIIAVLSPSTESTDRGYKFACYRRLPSLQWYILAQTEAPFLEVFERQPDNRWMLSELNGLDATLNIEAAGVSLRLREIYEKVAFPPRPAVPEAGPELGG